MASEEQLLYSGPVAQMPHSNLPPAEPPDRAPSPSYLLCLSEWDQALGKPSQRSSPTTSTQLTCHQLWSTRAP